MIDPRTSLVVLDASLARSSARFQGGQQQLGPLCGTLTLGLGHLAPWLSGSLAQWLES